MSNKKESRLEWKSKIYNPRIKTRQGRKHTYTHNKGHAIIKITRENNQVNEQLGTLKTRNMDQVHP